MDASGSGWGPLAVCPDHENEPSDSIKGGEFNYMSDLVFQGFHSMELVS
jgi:hypothetical protein